MITEVLDDLTAEEVADFRAMVERKMAARQGEAQAKAIGALRALLSVECVCDPRPIGNGRVYHMQDCLYDRIRDYMDDGDIARIMARDECDDCGRNDGTHNMEVEH